MEAEAQPTNLEGLSEDDLPLDDDEARARLTKIRRLERWRARGPWVVIPVATLFFCLLQSLFLVFLQLLIEKDPFQHLIELWYLPLSNSPLIAIFAWISLPIQIKNLRAPPEKEPDDTQALFNYAIGFMIVGFVMNIAVRTFGALLWPSSMVMIASVVFYFWASAKRARKRWHEATKPIGKLIVVVLECTFFVVFAAFLFIITFIFTVLPN